MKKKLSVAMAFILAASLCACGGSGSSTTAAETTAASATSAESTTGGSGEAADSSASTTAAADAGTTPDKTYTLKMSYTISGDETVAQCAQEMAQKVTERTNGGITFENYANGELATDVDALELCAQGANVISFGTPDFLATYVADLGILDGPFLFNDPSEFSKVDESDWMKDMRSKLESQGIKNLGMSWYFGARELTYSGDKAVTKPEDLKGMKIRSASSPTRVGMLEAMGATVTQMNWSEVYSALNQGLCEGCEAPLSTLYNSKIYEVCKNVSLTHHIMAIWSVNMSKDYFDSMPEEYQQILMEEIANMAPTTIERVQADETEYRKQLEDLGVTFYECDRDAFREATLSVYDSISDWTPGLYDVVTEAINS